MTPGAMTELGYSYATASALSNQGVGSSLSLATSGGSTPSGEVAHPFFFSGFVEHPAVVAQGLLVLARVARTRFYVPPNMVAAVLRAADPVVTSTPEGLRLESFSACCGVYARLDVDADALEMTQVATGVTNVDVNPALRQALASMRPAEPLHLNVGQDQLRVTTLDGEVVEEKVPLPKRWLKGFAETQMLMAAMTQQQSLDAATARQFIRGLPPNSATKTVMWATPAVRSLRLATKPTPTAVCVAGPERLRVLEPMLRFATDVQAYSAASDSSSLPQASAWVVRLPGARLTIALSPEKARGFSGEGTVLHALSGAEVGDDADLISALLAFEPRIEIGGLSNQAGISPERVHSALALLASSGQVGYDLAAGAYFHRPLPVRPGALLELHPRLADAHNLVAAGVLTVVAAGYEVRSGETTYLVRLGTDPSADRCTCPWYAKHRASRGPCKHVVAARIVARRS